MKIDLNDMLNAKGVSEPLREAVKALQRENAELREALQHPSYEEENRLRAQVDRLRAELSVERQWVEEFIRQSVRLSAKIKAMKQAQEAKS